ncbi:MAG: hypothetical protein Greene041679_8 [Parcubacteria group bacterium Greene0416_79]|nr:MAG: hypothetical protein Greene041679_8 [Parcubacteria group bacterium Greene0416_79]
MAGYTEATGLIPCGAVQNFWRRSAPPIKSRSNRRSRMLTPPRGNASTLSVTDNLLAVACKFPRPRLATRSAERVPAPSFDSSQGQKLQAKTELPLCFW